VLLRAPFFLNHLVHGLWQRRCAMSGGDRADDEAADEEAAAKGDHPAQSRVHLCIRVPMSRRSSADLAALSHR
jgi:hypothetical protein